ncbi:MAG: terminase large subunit [Erysipelotrichia bacterium]|nr:terminase large subunit [Erysipelotrichia bacterium]
MTYLEQYVEAIESRQIIVGQELDAVLKQLVEDINDDRYIYDTKRAHRRIAFIERFCKHTKSPFHGKPFILELWEKAFIEVVYGFLRSSTKRRRFKRVILLISRKNGKSTLTAALAFTELMMGSGGSDIVCSSNDDAQASIIFLEIGAMREMFDPSSKRTHKNLRWIINKKNKSKVFKLSEKTQNKEGYNIEFGILDESHEMKDNSIAKPIEQSQSTKDEPLFVNITTEGFVNDGYLDKELQYARRVIAGEYEDDTLLAWLYTQDSEAEVWQDESSWMKSNPSLGLIKKREYLRDQINKAKLDKGDRMYVLAKDFNIKQNNAEAWLMEQDYNISTTFHMEDFIGSIALGAVDLSETTDLTCAKVLLMKKGDPTKYIATRYFIPESKVIQGSIDDKKDYLTWAKEGLIEITEGNEVDLSKVAKWFLDLYKHYKIRTYKTGYDNRFAKTWLSAMDGYGLETERVDQNRFTLSNPMKLLEADLKSRLVNYNSHPIDKWCLSNTAIKVDNLGLVMPVKVNDMRNRRIDGAVTMIILYAMWQRYRTEFLEMLR